MNVKQLIEYLQMLPEDTECYSLREEHCGYAVYTEFTKMKWETWTSLLEYKIDGSEYFPAYTRNDGSMTTPAIYFGER